MKAFLAFLLITPAYLWAQLSVSDDFSDGDYSQNPVWNGDTALFTVSPAFELQLQDSVAGNSYLSTACSIGMEASWEFSLRLDFNPSASNYARFYLMSDQADLKGPLKGYFVRLGGSSADRISLYRQDGNSVQLLLESGDDWLDTDPAVVRLRVERSQGVFSMAVDTGLISTFQNIGQVSDSHYFYSSHTGLRCHYTLTRSDKFFFDNLLINGQAYIDSIAPAIVEAHTLDSLTLSLQFDEGPELSSALNPLNYQGQWGERPTTVTVDSTDSRLLYLHFAAPFLSNQLLTLTVSGVQDRFGNAEVQRVYFYYYRPTRGDLLISEIMADPSPVVGLPPSALPQEEYLEIYNRSNIPLSLAGWELLIGNQAEDLPAVVLPPGAYLLLCRTAAVGLFPDSIRVEGLEISTNTLNNSGQELQLRSPEAFVTDRLRYTDQWYRHSTKAEGGWSLERIDLENHCEGAQNWRASENAIGGTPGYRNSVAAPNPDTTAPFISGLALEGDTTVVVSFSEELFGPSLLKADNYRIEPDPGIERVDPLQQNPPAIRLSLQNPLETSLVYQLWLDSPPRDCAANLLLPDTLLLGIPEQAQPGDVLINEILFNPYPGGSDFVELHNTSDRLLDLAKLRVGNWDAHLQLPSGLIEVLKQSYLFPPHTYLVLSTDIDFLAERYQLHYPERAIAVEGLPSLPDDGGSLVICNSALETLDYVIYTDDWHSPLLSDDEGVSLERISLTAPTRQGDNWHSAAATAGFATPGYQNSQYFAVTSQGRLELQPRVFSPNLDGYKDVLQISYHFNQPGSMMSLSVWSSDGILVKELQRNTLVGSEGFFSWDGTDQSGNRLNSGIYIVVAEIFNPAGGSETIRKSCVLSL